MQVGRGRRCRPAARTSSSGCSSAFIASISRSSRSTWRLADPQRLARRRSRRRAGTGRRRGRTGRSGCAPASRRRRPRRAAGRGRSWRWPRRPCRRPRRARCAWPPACRRRARCGPGRRRACRSGTASPCAGAQRWREEQEAEDQDREELQADAGAHQPVAVALVERAAAEEADQADDQHAGGGQHGEHEEDRERVHRAPVQAWRTRTQAIRPWHCLYFLPEPHGQGALRGTLPQVEGSAGSMLEQSSPLGHRQGPARAPAPRRSRPGPAGGGARRLRLLHPDLEVGEHLGHRLAQVGQHAPRTGRTPRACTR